MKTKLLVNLVGVIISIVSISTFSITTYGQIIRCATVENDSLLRLENPDLQSDQDFEAWLAEKIEERRQLEATGLIINGVYQIPVVVHVVHNGEAVGSGTNISYATILSQIDVLNEDFRRIMGTNGYNTHPDGADTQIEFCLARRRPDGSAFPNGEHGVNRINRNTAGFSTPPYSMNYTNTTIKPYCTVIQNWSPSRYMNFWSINLGDGLLGYAQFPTTILGGMGCGSQSANTDGVVMLYSSIGKSAVTGRPGPYNEGRTATHEIGHWLGLRHIWGDSPNCAVDDFCLDTPPSDAANYGCLTNHQSCGSLDMVQNYMDYSDDLCMNIFTNDQRMRMRTVLENSPIRASLITSDACVPPAVNDASVVTIINPKGDHCPGSITPTVVLRNRGSANLTSATIRYTIDGGTPVNFNWTGNIAPAGSANVTLPAFTTTLGIHTFNAVSLMPNGVADPHTTFDASEITFAVSNGYQPNYSQDFDGGQFPPDVRWTVVNPNSDCYAWVGATAVSSAGVTNNACAVMTNYGNGTNQDEYLYTPYFILPCNAASAQLSFDVAYRKRVTGSTDRLRVEISTNCGATWQSTPIYDKSGTTLQTVTTTQDAYWIPTAAGNWRTETINLASFVGPTSSSVQFRFRATNAGSGGNVYVDNVRMTASQPVEIRVSANGTEVLDGGFFNFGTQTTGATVTQTFTVQNTGTSALTLTPPITITGASQFSVSNSFGSTTIPAGGSTTFVISFTPNGIGPFTAVLSFTNNDCDEGTYNFELAGAGDSPGVVTAGFSTSQTTICSGSTVTFTDNSVGATSWNWNFGAGATPSTATGAGPHTVTYTTSGTKTISLSVNGGAASTTGTVQVNATPTPAVSVSNTCGSSTLTATGSNLVWSTGATTPSITVSSAGTYTVTQTVGGCTSASASATASPTATPAAPTVSVSNTCGSSTLTATGSNLVWSTGATTPSITVSSAGTYTVTQTVGGCTSASASATASPIATPTAPTVSVSNTCGSSTLTATGSNLVWSTGATTPSITVSSAGTYTVTQTVGGCTSASASATASPIATPTAPTVSVSNTCGSSTLTATGSNLVWSTGATTPSITVSSAGTYTVTQTVGGCTSASASVSASPLDLPVVTFGSLSNFCVNHSAVSLTSGTPAGGNYSGNGVTNGVFDPAIAGVGTWNLSYSYTDGNGCTNTAQTSAIVEACLGLEDKETSIFEIYPNPTNGLFTIVSTDPISVVQVMDNTGRLVYANSAPDHYSSIINLSGFADGIYQVLTTTDSGVRVSKIEIRK
ncbi:choice-of-anchor D domain-containing protein [Crocinitomicaceae bacterium CZZ-1]|uniref:Choice-of-anchor D domain-containing protein n=1 Tax=Taishania pollutisoli TaxID=2766479 RepID=A0A8J6PIA9_9FLAO|nr:choice-of-anchor D domain-containing protein [Taishania pollutisoli]MBC9811505.1 choice-of-anchor D domain-containing protein [Taishania pollutisoli]